MYALPVHLISLYILSTRGAYADCASDLTLVFVNKGMYTLPVHLISLYILYTEGCTTNTLPMHLISL